MRFEFATANRILFGAGTLAQIGTIAAGFGRSALVVTGGDTGRAAPLLRQLETAGVAHFLFAVPHEPTVALVAQGTDQARADRVDLVIGCGGGSALDAAKAIAALLRNPGHPLDYLEGIGQGRPLAEPSAPSIAVPTTAGTGAEVTRNAVLAAPEHRVKVSMRSATMLPRVALVDPELTYSVPPAVSASTGMDALIQLMEPFVSPQANPLTDALCREGLPRAARALPRVYAQGDDRESRQEMALASLLGGLALANAKLGAVHGFAGVLGGMVPAPHGALCACLLPPVLATNLSALQRRAPAHPALSRYAELAHLLLGPTAQPADLVGWAQDLCRQFRIPGLATYGVEPSQVAAVAAQSALSSSMQGNPIPLSASELQTVLEHAL